MLIPLCLLPLLAAATPAALPPIHAPLRRTAPDTGPHDKRDGAGQLLRGFGTRTSVGLEMHLGTPPQPIAPVLSFGGLASPDLEGSIMLGTADTARERVNKGWRFFNSNDSSSFEKSADFMIEDVDAFSNSSAAAAGPPMKNFTAVRGTDMMALNGISRRQELVITSMDVVTLYGAAASDMGVAVLGPKSKFAADLLEGREPLLGLYAAPMNPNMADHNEREVYFEVGSGELTIGGVNPALTTGEQKWISSTNSTRWRLPLSGIKVGDNSLAETNLTAIPVASAEWTVVSRSLFGMILASIPNSRNATISVEDNTLEALFVPCSTNLPLTFSFAGGVDIAVPSSQWVASASITKNAEGFGPAAQEGECVAIILPAQGSLTLPDEKSIFLGWSFLSSTYTVFKYGDQPQMGFSPLTDAALGVEPQIVQGTNATPTVSIPGYAVATGTNGSSNSTSGPTSGASSNLGAAGLGAGAIALLAAVAMYAV